MSATIVPFPSRAGVSHEPLLSKKQLAAHYGFTPRWVELRMKEGMPSELIGGRRRFRLSETDNWLRSRHQ